MSVHELLGAMLQYVICSGIVARHVVRTFPPLLEVMVAFRSAASHITGKYCFTFYFAGHSSGSY